MRIYPGTPLWRTVAPEQAGETLADYLEKPRFYIERPLTMESLYHRLELVKQTMPNWALGDPPPEFMETLVKLRRRGIRANMWEYVELLQRLNLGALAHAAGLGHHWETNRQIDHETNQLPLLMSDECESATAGAA